MSNTIFNPLYSYCVDWRKIYPDYKRHLVFESHESMVCSECGAVATNRCSACHKVAYCSANHQKVHWKSVHRSQCSPFKLATDPDNPKVGRFVVATRDLAPGDVIIEEPPVTAGPKQFTPLVCLGCHKTVDGTNLCINCGWPMCGGKQCSETPLHKESGECDLLAKCKLKPKIGEGIGVENPIYECLTPMRCVLIKSISSDNWKVMQHMEQHTEERKCEPFYPVNQTNTVRFLKQHILNGLPEDNEEVTEEEINAMVDVLDVNAFEIRGPEFSIRGVYPLTAMMNSVCSPNTQNCIDRDFVCRVRAVVPIKKGEEITTSYTLTLAGTLYRRRHLQESKYFECCCKRCSDPTELGSHFSTMLCQKCGSSGHMTTCNPLNNMADWKCSNCDHFLKHKDVDELIETLEKEVSLLPLERDVYEEQLTKYAKMLHQNHHIMIDLKFTLVQLYGRDKPGKEEMMEHALRKKQLCESVLAVMSRIIPGHFRLRGMFLSEMYGILLFLAKRAYEAEDIDKAEFLHRLEIAKDILEESIQILSYEPLDTVEGIRCQTAREFRIQLERLVQNLHEKEVVPNQSNKSKQQQQNNKKKNRKHKK